MATAALPPGASILSISGKRCTAIPRTATGFLNSNSILVPSSAANPPAATTQAITTAPPQAPPTPVAPAATSTDIQAAAVAPSPNVVSLATTSGITSLQTTSTTEAFVSTSNSIPSSPPLPILSSSVPIISSDSVTATISSSVSPASTVVVSPSITPIVASLSSSTVAAKTTSSTPSALASDQSERSPIATSTNDGILSGIASTTSTSATLVTSAATEATSAAVTSEPKMPVGTMVGGILGGFALIGIFGFIIWLCVRRRRRQRDSFLTPLGSDPSDLSRSTSPTSNTDATSPFDKLRAQASSTFIVVGGAFSNLKNKVRRRSNDSVNMNRGHSQFLEQIPQHSRQNSALSVQPHKPTMKERFDNWIERVKEDYLFRIRVRHPGKEKDSDPFAIAREKQAAASTAAFNTSRPDFSQLLAMEERELRIATEQRQQALANGSLGLNFDNPFSDPEGQNSNKTNPFADPSNPFRDPESILSAPKASQSSSSGYVAGVRRSCGQSISQAVPSRYPSTYAPDRDSYGYRDTYMSSATDGRKTKGRSDPFDLEKLPLEAANPPLPLNGSRGGPAPRVVSQAVSEVSAAGTYSSKYSNATVSDWSGPGPDLGSGLSNLNFGNLDVEQGRQDDRTGLARNLSNGSKNSVGKAI